MNTTHSTAFSSNGYRAETQCQMPNGKALTLWEDYVRQLRQELRDGTFTREKLAEFVKPWQITGSVGAYKPVG